MSYRPELPPVVPPPGKIERERDWLDFIKRYMADHGGFRENLRAWIRDANACCDDNTAAITALDTRIDALEALGLTVPVPVAKGGTASTTASDARTALGFATDILRCRMTFLAGAGADLTLDNVASTADFLAKDNRNIQQADLTPFTQARIGVRIKAAATSGTRLLLTYRTSFSTTVTDYADIGTSAVQADLSSTGISTSSWIDLATSAKADVFVAVKQAGGDGATDPVISHLWAEFRRR